MATKSPKTRSRVLNIRPHVHRKFDRSKARDLIRRIVVEELEGKAYESAHGSDITRRLSRRIHDAVRQLPCDRYKFTVQVVIGEKLGQGVKCSGGCLWDDDTDCWVSTSLNLESMYCVATVFAIYCCHYE